MNLQRKETFLLLAAVSHVSARLGRAITEDEEPRVLALLEDAAAFVTDFCGLDFTRHVNESIELPGQAAPLLQIPRRYAARLDVSSAALDDGEPVSFSLTPRGLYRPEGWSARTVTLTASWGPEAPPPLVVSVVCAEVIRWLSVSPGTLAEKTGDLEIHYAASASAQGLSEAARTALSRYRPALGSIQLSR